MRWLRRFLLAVCLTLVSVVPVSVFAQSNARIRQLEAQRSTLQRQIAETEELLKTNRRNVGSQLNELSVLTSQIADRKRLVDAIAADIDSVDTEIRALNAQLATLQQRLAVQRKDYEASVLYMYRNRNVRSRLMFVLSADRLSQMYRRLRYVSAMAEYQQRQGEEIQRRQQQIGQQQTELCAAREQKSQLLAARDEEVRQMEGQERRQQDIIKDLRSKQRSLQADIAKQRRQADQLNNQIDKYIAEELERQRKEAERAAKAERERKAAAGRSASANRDNAAASSSKAETSKTETETYNTAKPDAQLSASFAANRGKLPLPITGQYIITSHYGQYNVKGLKNVTLDNKGINIQGRPGAQARAVFNGTVVAIFKLNGLYNILVRHGEYISVYCNLTSASVKQGDKVSTRQTLGPVYSDPSDGGRTTLHFQLRREKQKLNPELWLNK